jgi:hypothetical protein
MKTIALAGALCLLFSSSTLCKADSGPRCKPDVVMMTFKNQQGRDFARIELRSLKAVCDRNPEKKGLEQAWNGRCALNRMGNGLKCRKSVYPFLLLG